MPTEMIKQSNVMLLELAREPKTTKKEFLEIINQLR